MTTPIPLGFAVESGQPVAVPLKHLAITGMTQEAGKTTALEALLGRSGRRAIAFITKRGERAFRDGRRLTPFFTERTDWLFVASLIDATMGEKNKLLRAWLMKVCRNTRTLADVQRNVRDAKATARGFSESIYTEIDGYLELVVPQLAQLPPPRPLDLVPGLNVMDLTDYSSALQALVIRSVLEHVYLRETEVITVIPEAWEFLPEHRGSPVKLAAEALIRKGASLQNYLWIDSQDLAGVWKTIIRACAVMLIGVQREANEVRRTLENIPADLAKPKAADVARLQLGQFYASYSHRVVKTYVQPLWMPDDVAQQVARGAIDVSVAMARAGSRPAQQALATHVEREKGASKVTRQEADQLRSENSQYRQQVKRLERQVAELSRRLGDTPAVDEPDRDLVEACVTSPGVRRQKMTLTGTNGHLVDEAAYQEIKTRLMLEAPQVLRVLSRPELEVAVARTTVTADGSSTKGRVARLLADGFLTEQKRFTEILRELERTGTRINNKSLAVALQDLLVAGFVTKEAVDRYQAAPGATVRVVEG